MSPLSPVTPISIDVAILWPMTVVVALTIVSAIRLVTLRMRALRTQAVSMSFYQTYRDGAEPEAVAAATRHYANLFEMPVLFYLGCVVSGLLGPVSTFTLITAWGFTLFRVMQSVIHLTSNHVKRRAYAFFASCAFLILLWANTVVSIASR